MESKKPKIAKKKILKSRVKKIYPDTPRILLWFIVLIIVFILSTLSIFWLRAPNLLMKSKITNIPKGPVWGEFLTFRGPGGFTFNYPNWSQIKMEDLPPNSFPEEIKLLLMETDNKFMQLMALETSADLTKDLKTLISEDLKMESEKVRDLKVVQQEIKDGEALLELTYFTDGFMVRMFSRDFLVKGEKENKVYSLAVQLVDSKLSQYENIRKQIINSARIVAQ